MRRKMNHEIYIDRKYHNGYGPIETVLLKGPILQSHYDICLCESCLPLLSLQPGALGTSPGSTCGVHFPPQKYWSQSQLFHSITILTLPLDLSPQTSSYARSVLGSRLIASNGPAFHQPTRPFNRYLNVPYTVASSDERDHNRSGVTPPSVHHVPVPQSSGFNGKLQTPPNQEPS